MSEITTHIFLIVAAIGFVYFGTRLPRHRKLKRRDLFTSAIKGIISGMLIATMVFIEVGQ